MWQIVFAYVSFQVWTINPNIQSFLDGSHEVLVLSPHYTKIIYANPVTSDDIMVIYGGSGLLMLLEHLSKCSGGFSYIFFITLHPVTFISVDDSTFLQYRILVLWSNQEVSDGNASFKMDLHPMLVACSLQAFTQPFVIWYH